MPSRLPKKPNFWGVEKPLLIAHRGGAGLYVPARFKKENTLDVFRAAVDLGYEYLELDVISTSDDIVIVLHVTTDRFEALLHKPSAPNAKRLESLTYMELKKYLGRDIPTLREILREFPTTKFLIDSKTDAVVEPLAREIINAKAFERVFLNSFYLRRVKKLQQLLGNKVTYGLIIGRYPRLFNRKLNHFKAGKYADAGLTALVVPHRFISKNLVELIHNNNLKVLAWTPNIASSINYMIACGVDGINSDNIQLLKKIALDKK